jgi:transcriptional regulator with XRE-family HTH domain
MRKASKLTQEQVVAKLQLLNIAISRSVYAQIKCETYNIRISELAALKQIFHVDYTDFFKGTTLGTIPKNRVKILSVE